MASERMTIQPIQRCSLCGCSINLDDSRVYDRGSDEVAHGRCWNATAVAREQIIGLETQLKQRVRVPQALALAGAAMLLGCWFGYLLGVA